MTKRKHPGVTIRLPRELRRQPRLRRWARKTVAAMMPEIHAEVERSMTDLMLYGQTTLANGDVMHWEARESGPFGRA